MNYENTSRYFKTTSISAVALLASIAAIMAILAIVDVVTWNDVPEVLWRTAAIMAVIVALSAVTGMVIDWAKKD